jgi:hypothetical protein
LITLLFESNPKYDVVVPVVAENIDIVSVLAVIVDNVVADIIGDVTDVVADIVVADITGE